MRASSPTRYSGGPIRQRDRCQSNPSPWIPSPAGANASAARQEKQHTNVHYIACANIRLNTNV